MEWLKKVADVDRVTLAKFYPRMETLENKEGETISFVISFEKGHNNGPQAKEWEQDTLPCSALIT